MVVFPNAKINLGLQILSKRPDGYHDLRTIFYPVPIRDVLEIIPAPARPEGAIRMSVTGLSISGESDDNLCVKACRLLAAGSPLPSLELHLHKHIPMGAGLGGGSSDGAHTLLLLDKRFELGLSTEQLMTYALQLGSDCPFFIYNRPCIAEGRGERLQPLSVDLSAYSILIVNPGIHVSTAWAFARLDPMIFERNRPPLEEVAATPVHTWKAAMDNDFEAVVMSEFPRLAELKRHLYEQGALYASMSGSGSTLFGIFHKHQGPRSITDCASFYIS